MATTTPPVLLFCLCVVVFNSGLVAAEEKVVSRMKPTRLSKLWESGFSSRITDNDKDKPEHWERDTSSRGTIKGVSYCSYSQPAREGEAAWIEVDLLEVYSVTVASFILLHPSWSFPSIRRIRGAKRLLVHDGDPSNFKECTFTKYTNLVTDLSDLEYACNAEGRYVRVLQGTDIHSIFLSLCHLEIKAEVGDGKEILENVAVGKTASQSSTVGAYSASLAVDDRIVQIIDDGPGCAVANGTSPWWEVDLGGLFDITHVAFTNRAKEFEKLRDVYVGVREKKDPRGEQVCGPPVNSVGSGQTVVVACARERVRYVKLWISEEKDDEGYGDYDESGTFIPALKEQTLTLCEVQVYGTPSPPRPVVTEQVVSFNKPTNQSSVEGLGFATRAVDGNKDTNLKTGQSCSQTKREGAPWWRLDLIDSFKITKLRITVPPTEKEEDRVKTIVALVYNSVGGQEGERCVYQLIGPLSGKTTEFECRAVGRYVQIFVINGPSVVGGNSLREVLTSNSKPANPFWAATSKVLESVGAVTSDVLTSLGSKEEANSGFWKGSGMDSSSKVEKSVGVSNPQDESNALAYLSLCEVEVVAEVEKGELIPKNVAPMLQFGSAEQSTTSSEFYAAHAIDDDLDPAKENTASLTLPQYKPTWELELTGSHNVSHVAFTLAYCEQCQPPRNIWLIVKSRKDKGVSKHIEQENSRGDGYHKCGPFEKLVLGGTTLVHCPLQDAGFVDVWIESIHGPNSTDQLRLSEVQVYSKQPASWQPMPVPPLVLCAMLVWGVMLLTMTLA